jgi:hypothetical protein
MGYLVLTICNTTSLKWTGLIRCCCDIIILSSLLTVNRLASSIWLAKYVTQRVRDFDITDDHDHQSTPKFRSGLSDQFGQQRVNAADPANDGDRAHATQVVAADGPGRQTAATCNKYSLLAIEASDYHHLRCAGPETQDATRAN